MKPILLLFILLTPLFAYFPCGRCVLKGDPCTYDTCVAGLKCVSLGGAPICVDQIDRHQPCNDTNWYDACPEGFFCDRTTSGKCELSPTNKNFGLKNDGCFNSDYCVTGLTCKNNLCVSSQVNGACATSADCNWNEYCGTTGGSSSQCKSFPASGETCAGTCKYMTTCSNGKCVDFFSIEDGGACTTTQVCKTGLICKDGQCKKPTYDLLLGPGVIFGQDCHPGESGCTCNIGLSNYQFLREQSLTFMADCPDRMKNFEKCMTTNGCTSINLKADTCLRRKCFAEYAALDYCSTDAGLVARRCGDAGNLAIMIVFMIVLMLSF